MAVPNYQPSTLFISDNLPVLRGMDGDTVDLVYLDPPFNSKREYRAPIGTPAAGQSFDDTWRWDALDERWLGEIDRRNPALSAVIHAARLTQGDGTGAYLAFMGVRLLELARVMKPAASIYLHCDDAANAYLRASMDAVFGKSSFRNEIVWKRTAGRSDASQFGRVHDNILFYAAKTATWNRPTAPHAVDSDYVRRSYRHDDGDGRGPYRASDITAAGIRKGESGEPWRGIDPTRKGRHWGTPTKGGMNDFIRAHGMIPSWPDAYPSVHQRLDAMDAAGLIHWPKKGGGMPSMKRYLASAEGVAVEDIFADIGKLEAQSKEKTGWATQKPLALLQRIIRASSNPDDLVLDPFAGCATCCVAAAIEGRRWVAIEACEAAADIVQVRLSEAAGGELGAQADLYKAHIRRNPPTRTDLNDDEPKPNTVAYRTQANLDYLYGVQRGNCIGCGLHYHAKDFHIDHITPRSQGGTDDLDNLQLLCGHCNSTKGNSTMDELRRRLKEQNAEMRARLGQA